MQLEVRCELKDWSRNVSFAIVGSDGESRWFAERLAVHKLAHDEPPRECFNLPPAKAQLLMDELWRVGLRPSEGSGSAGSLAATERHLADMRRLVFKDNS